MDKILSNSLSASLSSPEKNVMEISVVIMFMVVFLPN